MTPLVFVLVIACVLLLGFCIVTSNDYRRVSKKYAEEGEYARNEYKELRDKYMMNLEIGNAREQILKRALQDLAEAEIDRARFALEVVYGKPQKKC